MKVFQTQCFLYYKILFNKSKEGIILLILNFKIYMYGCLTACMSVPKEARRGHQILITGVTVACVPPCMC